ncbi:MAG: type IV pilus biogenesis/stability protein PilW [Proteobacteria bacterium]|uniref:type IV pilus biogenesis/stability protein PilW n=1 Tax=Aquabacterium sp. TaxID=1872578 RepID=UPI0035C6B97D|nr:type IV pilus biogenesis/stability protein PilW [Pseudomonadota bacterium]
MRMRSVSFALAASGFSLSLLGCAGAPGQPRSTAAVTAAQGDIATASDESEVRRRARIRLELASTYYAQGQYNTALDELKQAVTIDPTLPAAHEMRALIYDAMGDAERADASFRQALSLDPGNGSVLHNHAWSLCRRGQYAAADALFDRAAALPQSMSTAKTLLARGVCQIRAGLYPEGEKSLLKSYEIDPASPATAYNLAAVLMRQGELERARFYARRINNVPEQVTAESLWLAIRIEHRLGNFAGRDELATQLRRRFTGSREATALELGRYDE